MWAAAVGAEAKAIPPLAMLNQLRFTFYLGSRGGLSWVVARVRWHQRISRLSKTWIWRCAGAQAGS
jgi:hypothetical protein